MTILADFGSFIGSTLGLASWTVLAFVAGAVFGTSVWGWVKSKLPWFK